jgi:acyl phosphate:glycerol-3-phosphate acyltransferase
MLTVTTVVFLVFGYVVGSLSSAIITCRLMGLPDPRTQGSQNPGTTNVLRIAGKKAAALTLLGDVLKGTIPVLLAHAFGVKEFALGLVAMAAFVGHIFPLFFKFQGGKGVATAFGVILALSWQVAVAVLITWLVVAAIFRYSSLAALVAAVLSPLYMVIFSSHYSYLLPLCCVVLILLWRHSANIQRLRSGTESKINFSK